MGKKKQKDSTWWKFLIVMTFIISLTILIIQLFDIVDVDVIKSGKFGTNFGFNSLDRDKITIIYSYCNYAEVYYPLSEPNKIWIKDIEIRQKEDGYCHLIYKKSVKRIRFALGKRGEQ